MECVCVPVPGETILVGAAVYAGKTHNLNIWSIVCVAVAAGIAGNIVAFWIGRKFGYGMLIRYGSYLRLRESRLRIGQYLFLHYGGKVIFFARFLPLLRSIAGVLAEMNTGVVVLGDPRRNRVDVAPHDQRVDQAVAALAGQIVVGESQAPEVGDIV